MTLALLCVLWQPASCLMPPAPPPEKTPNLPPVLEPSKIEPPTNLLQHELGSVLQFSIENAVSDPEGDELDIIWYYVASQDGIPRLYSTRSKTTSIDPCQYILLKQSPWFLMVVIVSDAALVWQGDTNLSQPVFVEEGFVPAQWTWVVRLTGTCSEGGQG